MKKLTVFFLLILLILNAIINANQPIDSPINRQISIIGGGIIGAFESYYAYQDAQKNAEKICITVYEKNDAFTSLDKDGVSTNTSYNIAPSLTIDEILSVVPRGSQLVEKLGILF